MNKLVSALVIALIVFAVLFILCLAFALVKHIASPSNESPVITLNNTNINAKVGDPLILNATVSDDGTISSIIWDQVAGPKSNFTQIDDDLYFTPTINGTYIFKLEVQDDKQQITTKGVQIVVSIPSTPTPTPPSECEPDEKIVNGKCVEIPRPTCTPDQVYNNTDNTCRPKPTPVPTPTPTPTPKPIGKDITIAVTGDVEDSTPGNAVFNQIKKQNPTYTFVLGDLGYQSDLDWFKSTYGTLGNSMYCVLGNHEAANEDGSSALEKEALQYCGNSYWIKNNTALFLMFNTNDKADSLTGAVGKVLSNTTAMKDVKSIHVMGHKGCATPPNSHHPAGEISKLCDFLKTKIPASIKVFYDSAHNHVYSESADKLYKQSGAGGKSHYTCGTNAQFPICNNTHYGYLLYTIKPDGTTTSSFIDSTGKVIH